MPYHEFLCVNQPRALIFVWSAVTLINHQNLIYLIGQCCLSLQSNALPTPSSSPAWRVANISCDRRCCAQTQTSMTPARQTRTARIPLTSASGSASARKKRPALYRQTPLFSLNSWLAYVTVAASNHQPSEGSARRSA